jgi:hypothetical protein
VTGRDLAHNSSGAGVDSTPTAPKVRAISDIPFEVLAAVCGRNYERSVSHQDRAIEDELRTGQIRLYQSEHASEPVPTRIASATIH